MAQGKSVGQGPGADGDGGYGSAGKSPMEHPATGTYDEGPGSWKVGRQKTQNVRGLMRLWIVGSLLWSFFVMMLLWEPGVAARNSLSEALFLWLGPCLFILALGWALGWGFRADLPRS